MVQISVIMANYNGADYLEQAVKSVLRQTHRDLELIISDDASPDDSLAVIRKLMKSDERIVLVESGENAGAAAARNRALEQAKGAWVAIMDSDDIMHPCRLERMLAAAHTLDVEMIADDLVFFSDSPEAAGRTLFQRLQLRSPRKLTLLDLILSDVPRNALPEFGYIKPLIKVSALGGLRYDTSMPISEDWDFYLRLLERGVTCQVLPDPMYLYRRHAASLSYRLSVIALENMLFAQTQFEGRHTIAVEVRRALRERRAWLKHLLHFQRLVDQIKGKKVAAASATLLRHPSLVWPLFVSIRSRAGREAQRRSTHSSQELSLGGGSNLTLENIPEPGGMWNVAIADVAAEISKMSAADYLEVKAAGGDGLWLAGLVPRFDEMSINLVQNRGSHDEAMIPEEALVHVPVPFDQKLSA